MPALIGTWQGTIFSRFVSTLNQKFDRIVDKTPARKLTDDANIDKFPVLEIFDPLNKWHKVYAPYEGIK